MNRRIEILVEEPSMEVFLVGLLPRILPKGYEVGINCFVYPHSGKSDLQKRLPNRIRAYRNYPEEVLLLVIQDQDSSDCLMLKNNLIAILERENGNPKYLVRIACTELENWYLGDLNAIEEVYPKSKASRFQNKAKFRDLDRLSGTVEMNKLCDDFSKTACAREISTLISISENKSDSYNQFISGLWKLLS